MITKQDLLTLGYNVKSERNGSIDFRYGEEGERQYLINLSQHGEITLIKNSLSSMKDLFTSDLNKFINWHNQQ